MLGSARGCGCRRDLPALQRHVEVHPHQHLLAFDIEGLPSSVFAWLSPRQLLGCHANDQDVALMLLNFKANPVFV